MSTITPDIVPALDVVGFMRSTDLLSMAAQR
jgi:hypothetical protein